MPEEQLLSTSEFEQVLNTFLTKYKNNYFSKAALNSLQKTFHTHNITIQDWNTILAYLNSNVEGIDDLAKIVEHIAKYAIRDSSLRDFLLNNYYNKEDVKEAITAAQTTVSIIQGPLTNINGRTLTAYTATQTQMSYGQNTYTVYVITKDGQKLTEKQARDYMEYMCGSRFLPLYNFEKPRNTYFMLPNGTFLKPKYDSTNGLLLFKFQATVATTDYVDTENTGQFPIISNNTPQGNVVPKQAWFDTEEDTDEDNTPEENYETNNRNVVSNDEIEYNYEEEQPVIQDEIEYNYEGV